jgi:hypothetical protein
MSQAHKGQWIGLRPSNREIFAVMFVGVAGIMIAGVGPDLLGNLERTNRLTSSQLGQAFAAELLTLGLAAFMSGAVLKPERLKAIGVVMALALAGLNAATPLFSGDMVIAIRAVAGLPSGVLMWITVAMIARTPTPERWSGAYLAIQTLAQLLMSRLIGPVTQGYGADAGWLVLAAFFALTAMVAVLSPSRLATLPRSEGNSGLPGGLGWVALVSAFLYSGFTICVFTYQGSLSGQAGHTPDVANTSYSVSLAAQVAGAAIATVLAGRVNWLWTVIAAAVATGAVLYGLYLLPSPGTFLILAGAFGFLWLFVLPFLVPMVIEADPSRRAAVLIGGAQVLGGSFGPYVASQLITATDARGAILFSGACMIIAVLIAFTVHQIRTKTAAVTKE